jgi:ribosomal protein S18 acetylase RimI-like enzyme
MIIRPFASEDLDTIISMTIEIFRPFFENYVRPLYGPVVFNHQHPNWQQDYRDEIPTLHDPAAGKHIAVAQADDAIAGYVCWRTDDKPNHGEIYLLGVAPKARRQNLGRRLCLHAIEEMRTMGVEVIAIHTGQDPFHDAARTLYEHLGFLKVPMAGYLKAM